MHAPLRVALVLILAGFASFTHSQAPPKLERVEVDGQPLGANVTRLLEALQFLGAPLPEETTKPLQEAAKAPDAAKMQQLLDPHVLVQVTINPESRVKVARGPAAAALQQGGFTPVLIKVV